MTKKYTIVKYNQKYMGLVDNETKELVGYFETSINKEEVIIDVCTDYRADIITRSVAENSMIKFVTKKGNACVALKGNNHAASNKCWGFFRTAEAAADYIFWLESL